MISKNDRNHFLRLHHWKLTLLALCVPLFFIYFFNVPHNPPGFYIDESSIAYNAYTISRTGRDEFGAEWPLFFRAFGDYKNPVYVYLLAALFSVTGPSILVARLFSATLGILAVAAIGILATRISERREVGVLVGLNSMLTPWLFETSRVVMEVALYPLVTTLFLLCLHRASLKARWAMLDVACLATTLGLLTYTYSIGRVLAPLLAFGLIFFATRQNWVRVLQAWGAYTLTLLPLAVFSYQNPGALTARFQIITYITTQASLWEIVIEFLKHYFGNLDLWRLLVTGDPNPDQVAHLYGNGHMLAGTVFLAVLGIYLVLRYRRGEPWWRFIAYGLAVSLVPASLTNEYFHMLRLVALPVLLLVLTVPALSYLCHADFRRRSVLLVLVAMILLQGTVFQYQFHLSLQTPERIQLFDAEYRGKILEPALDAPQNPIYLADALAIPGYIQAYWYATLLGVDPVRFLKLPAEEPPPLGALVISTEENCPRCQILATVHPYTLYIAVEPARVRESLPEHAFRAHLEVSEPSLILRTKQQTAIRVLVKNKSEVTWLARERSGGRYQVSLGNHWLGANGTMLIHDDGRSALLNDLKPGEEIEIPLTIRAPRKTGEYLLEIDMLQEEVSWFGLKGSPTIRLPVRVE